MPTFLGGAILPKAKVTVSLGIKHIVWLDKEIEKWTFANRSEGIQHCIDQKMNAPEPPRMREDSR